MLGEGLSDILVSLSQLSSHFRRLGLLLLAIGSLAVRGSLRRGTSRSSVLRRLLVVLLLLRWLLPVRLLLLPVHLLLRRRHVLLLLEAPEVGHSHA